MASPLKEIRDLNPLSLRKDIEDYLYPVKLPLEFIEVFIANVLKMAYAKEMVSNLFLPPSSIQVESGFRYTPKEYSLPNNTKSHVTLSLGYDEKERHIDVCNSCSLLSEKHLPDIFNKAMRRSRNRIKSICHVCYIGPIDPKNRCETVIQFLRNYAELSKILPNSIRSRDFKFVLPFWWIEDLRLRDIPEEDYLTFVEHPILKHLVSNAWVKGDRFWEKYERKYECPISMLTL